MGYTLGPIVIIDDDIDDREVLRDVFHDLQVPNELKFFDDCEVAYQYLEKTKEKPFLIFSDINLPRMSGADLKRKINANDAVRQKSIPFIFLTTTSSNNAVLDAYESLAQGFFTKPNSIVALKQMVQMILDYWKISQHPNSDLL